MNQLSNYTDEEQDFIINLGIFIYNEHRKQFQTIKKDNYGEYLEKTKEIMEKGEENKALREKLDKKNKELTELYEGFHTKTEEKVRYFKEQIDTLQQEKGRLLELFENNVERETLKKTSHLKTQIAELQKKNNYYYNLYVDSNKGSFYESELYDKMVEYNNKKLNNIWRITHVGSQYAEKCDFMFRHKNLELIFLLDTKDNNDKPVPKDDIHKFVRDVTNKENNAIGGILLANGSISKKKNYEMNIVNNKSLIYISHFSFSNVEFIFTTLEMMIEMNKVNKQTLDTDTIKQNLIEDYLFIKERISCNNTETKKLEMKLKEVSDRYFTIFNDDIEIASNTKPKTKVSKNVANTVVLDFEELEQGRKVVGKRKKYYLQYEEKGVKKIQYFQNNYAKTKKIDALNAKSNNKNTTINIVTSGL